MENVKILLLHCYMHFHILCFKGFCTLYSEGIFCYEIGIFCFLPILGYKAFMPRTISLFSWFLLRTTHLHGGTWGVAVSPNYNVFYMQKISEKEKMKVSKKCHWELYYVWRAQSVIQRWDFLSETYICWPALPVGLYCSSSGSSFFLFLLILLQ